MTDFYNHKKDLVYDTRDLKKGNISMKIQFSDDPFNFVTNLMFFNNHLWDWKVHSKHFRNSKKRYSIFHRYFSFGFQ